MANDIVTNSFVNGTVADGPEVSTNFDDVVTMGNVNAVISMSAGQSVAGGDVLIAFDTEDSDPGGNYNNTAGNYKFVCPVDGMYLVTSHLQMATPADGNQCILRIYLDAAIAGQFLTVVGGAKIATVYGAQIVKASTNQAISIHAVHDKGSSITFGGSGSSVAHFSVALLNQ